jgi:acyl carrier protein
MNGNVQEQIRRYVAENFLFSSNGFHLDNDESFLESGVVDSLGVLELVTFVEETFRVRVLEDEIVPHNFDSVNRLAAYVAQKRA